MYLWSVTMQRTVTIVATATNQTLARGIEGQSAVRLEGNWYFDPTNVEHAPLQETDRLYVCPHKGTCNWIDLALTDATIPDVAWVYHNVKPNYEYIKDWIGFYGGTREATREVWEYES